MGAAPGAAPGPETYVSEGQRIAAGRAAARGLTVTQPDPHDPGILALSGPDPARYARAAFAEGHPASWQLWCDPDTGTDPDMITDGIIRLISGSAAGHTDGCGS